METPLNCIAGTRVPLPETIACPVCKDIFKTRGYYRHLKACLPLHDLDLAAYERQYPTVSYSRWHAFANQWRRLANFSATRFGLAGIYGCGWFHVDAGARKDCYYNSIASKDGESNRRFRKPETKSLLTYEDGRVNLRRSFYQFGEHLKGNLTLAIWPDLDNRFLLVDLDGRQTQHLSVLLERLQARGLPHHLEFSGSKGFHVWIFFRRVVPNAFLIALYDELCEGLETDRNVWPFRKGLIKLPLGLHPRTRNLACFLKAPSIPIPLAQQLDYFLAIQPVAFPEDVSVGSRTVASVWTGQKTPRSRRSKGNENSSPEWRLSDQECEDLLRTNTRPEGLSRYRLLFRLGVYLKQVEHRTEPECCDFLLAWSCCVSRTRERTLAYDVKRQVRNVFRLDVRRSAGKVAELDSHQHQWVLQHVQNILIDHVAAGHGLDRNQWPQARDALFRLAEHLVRLVLWRGGRAYDSFGNIAKRTGLSIKRVDKWLPLLCSDAEELVPEELPSRYRGKLLIRASKACRDRGLAQEYVLCASARIALRPAQDSAA